MKRMGSRTAILIWTPDARAQRVSSRRATGQGTRHIVEEGLPISAEYHSSGSTIPEGDQLSPGHAHEMQDEFQQAVSPVGRVLLRWHIENFA